MFLLERNSAVPMYIQIKNGLHREIEDGVLSSGSYLPSSRQLARDLGVSRITVTNAYDELEADGMVESKPGSGILVLPIWEKKSARSRPTGRNLPLWQESIDDIPDAGRLSSFLTLPQDMIRFDLLHSDLNYFPVMEFSKILNSVLREDKDASLDYEDNEGYRPLRNIIAKYLVACGINVTGEDVIITSGGHQAIDLIAQAILGPGDNVIVEEPTFVGALAIFTEHKVNLSGVPLDSQGMKVDRLYQMVEELSPRLIYTVPTFHNPTGTVMSAARRKELVVVAEQFHIPVIEDDYIREIRFGGPIPPPIAGFDRYGNIIHIGTFSKSIMPSLRLGYVVAQGPLKKRLSALKKKTDSCCSALLQRALYRYLADGLIAKHWKRISRISRQRQLVMNLALKKYFPEDVRWMMVEGGFATWIKIPNLVSVNKILQLSLLQGVSFVAGEKFYIKPADQPFIRLCFARVPEEQITHGVQILGEILKGQISLLKAG